MKSILVAATLIAGNLFAGAAPAMPIDPIKPTTKVVTVDYECGRGWHLNRWGECRRNRPPPPPPRWRRDRDRDWGPPRGHWHRPPPSRYWDEPPPGYHRY
ncbi:GCG_CRPN prefix-to-repeats domain-containing protein [Rhizobium deserti]|uniref:GCG_CRPN prefix-to-repeats domain-containing protein n=1 Tax=Rhizobium deserti TaxID=2547961 RepID=UPI001FDFECEF|nr:hypothetical protein [Rhizobium deserti]